MGFEVHLLELMQNKFNVKIIKTETGEHGIRHQHCSCVVQHKEAECEIEFKAHVMKILDNCCVTSLQLIAGDELAFHNEIFCAVAQCLGEDFVQGEMPQKKKD